MTDFNIRSKTKQKTNWCMQAHKDPIASYLLRNTQKIVLIYFHVIIFALVL